MSFSIPTGLPFRFPVVAILTPNMYLKRQSATPDGYTNRKRPSPSNFLVALLDNFAFRIAALIATSESVFGVRGI
jgi:hypothetical protein